MTESRDELVRELMEIWNELTVEEKILVLRYREALIEARKDKAV